MKGRERGRGIEENSVARTEGVRGVGERRGARRVEGQCEEREVYWG